MRDAATRSTFRHEQQTGSIYLIQSGSNFFHSGVRAGRFRRVSLPPFREARKGVAGVGPKWPFRRLSPFQQPYYWPWPHAPAHRLIRLRERPWEKGKGAALLELAESGRSRRADGRLGNRSLRIIPPASQRYCSVSTRSRGGITRASPLFFPPAQLRLKDGSPLPRGFRRAAGSCGQNDGTGIVAGVSAGRYINILLRASDKTARPATHDPGRGDYYAGGQLYTRDTLFDGNRRWAWPAIKQIEASRRDVADEFEMAWAA